MDFIIVKQFIDNECSKTLETLESKKIWICRKRSHPYTITLTIVWSWNMFAEKFVKSERFWLCCWSILFWTSSQLRFEKQVRFFKATLFCKMSNVFRYFLLALKLSARKPSLKKIYDDVHWNVWTNIKNGFARNNISKKRIPNTRFWIIISGSKSHILGDCSRTFFRIFFHFFVVVQPWWPTCLLTAANPRPLLPPSPLS